MTSGQQFRNPAGSHVGCSGWQYKHWRGDSYPAELATTRWFEHYAARFDTVEINNTFYRLPEAPTFQAWKRRAPRDAIRLRNLLRETLMSEVRSQKSDEV